MYAPGKEGQNSRLVASASKGSVGTDSALQNHGQGSQESLDDDEMLPLEERILNPKWRIRFEAYKEINALFYNEYSKR